MHHLIHNNYSYSVSWVLIMAMVRSTYTQAQCPEERQCLKLPEVPSWDARLGPFTALECQLIPPIFS